MWVINYAFADDNNFTFVVFFWLKLFTFIISDDGISIPSSYTSYLSPLQSSKLYNEIRHSREKDKHVLAHFETLYVVYLQNKKELAPSQKLFTFHHPNRGKFMYGIYKYHQS